MRILIHRPVSVLVFLLLGTANVFALSPRTAVSINGNDANAATGCVPTAPCRTFAVALGQTQVGGELVALDTGGFGPFTVTQTVSIIAAPGAYAAAQQGSGNAVLINAPASDVVLRGLTLNGVGTGTYGIETQAVGTLHIESCVIENFSSTAIRAIASGQYFIKDTLIRNNGFGVYSTAPTAPLSKVEIELCRIQANTHDGVVTATNGKITIRDSVINGNGEAGIHAGYQDNGPGEIIAEHVQTSYNATGVSATCGLCAVLISGSQISENTNGVVTSSSGIVQSMGNNFLKFNVTSDGTLGVPLALQ